MSLPSSRSWRIITLPDGATWRWRFGKTGITLRSPDESGHFVGYNALFPDCDVERAMWKKYFSVTPSDVCRAIATIRVTCEHPAHRRGTHGRLRADQEVCMNCGSVVKKERGAKKRWPKNRNALGRTVGSP